ncbi:Vacuolar morphogenesis protein-like protein [Hapsidospora chrysogenum ATCC 11550]|uniref:Vacuolar morphogenesis protein-like protein n=1 Tax=Hapsidospora chrysogenum (strain ATCC 11550 / CBS 779.69 / DSM 880 / IAM 14645 / JCM 23072 / IMI 49137) TaxID=857340 RepID=A0A086THT1_HAPC1|nr:Vacuolar morphogenesis protein-like protein [Hapsidospora chrysogenum ATCC 11550]
MAPPPEIAIPSTSVSGTDNGSKPFTLYNITLRLPLRSYVVQKRYSDFSSLHATLTQQVGSPPPEPLPGKHWLKSTVHSPDLTQQRQAGLERYLKAIAESPDRRWRDTSAWRAFLNLPTTSSASTSAVSAGGIAGNAAAGAADPHTWLDMHRELKACLHEARQCLSRRDGASDSGNSSGVAEAGTAAKRALVKGGTLISTLTDGLRKMQESKRLGDGELRRRRDLVSAARMERDGLEKLVNSTPASPSAAKNGVSNHNGQPSTTSDKAGLLRGGKPAGRVLGAPLPETARTRELDNAGVLQLQRQELSDQDAAIEQLSTIIQRQRAMGLQISEEVERQHELLARLDQDVDVVDGKIRVGNARLRKF